MSDYVNHNNSIVADLYCLFKLCMKNILEDLMDKDNKTKVIIAKMFIIST